MGVKTGSETRGVRLSVNGRIYIPVNQALSMNGGLAISQTFGVEAHPVPTIRLEFELLVRKAIPPNEQHLPSLSFPPYVG